MRRLRPILLLLGLAACAACFATTARAATGFDGVWTGKIAAPHGETEFGLAFTRTHQGLVVSVHFPEMFLHSANFGAAAIEGETFALAPLDLRLLREGDTLTGTFAPAKLRVTLQRGGTFSEEIPPPSFPAAPAPAWTLDLGAPAWASPAARDGFVYVGTTDGKFHAVRAVDGTAVWSWSGAHPLYGEALVTEDRVYFVDESGDLVCLGRLDGTLQWRTPLRAPGAAQNAAPENPTFNHRAPSPIIDAKGVLYVGAPDGGIHALRAKTGKPLWRHDARAPIYAPLALRGSELIAACFDGSLVVLGTRTRREVARARLGGPLVSAPVVAGDRIVVGARDYLLYAVTASKLAPAWSISYWFSWVESTPRLADGVLYIGGSDLRRVSAIDPATGRRLWATDVRGLSWGSPVVAGDIVYAGTAGQTIAGTVIQHKGGIVALDRTTGSPLWRYECPVVAGADFTGVTGSLVYTDGKIIAAQVNGTLIAFPASPSSSSKKS